MAARLESSSRPLVSVTGVFLAAAILALGWTLATDHVWEDYWITFRSSKNLATGHGLLHQHGERLHTFTSPLGVLLPALCSLLTGNQSDLAALWLFRLMGVAAFGGAAALFAASASAMKMPRIVPVVLVLWLMTDNKSLDFAANGMETSILLLFTGWMIWALFACRSDKAWAHLGAAWAGLMWTRPDSFITIAAMSAAVLLFTKPDEGGMTRKAWLHLFLKAAGLCTLLYMPWFAWAWWYYGTPVPHTVTAKGGLAGSRSLLGGLWSFVKQPVSILMEAGTGEAVLAPPNVRFGGWPQFVGRACRGTAFIAYLVWLVPGVRWQARAASLAYAVFIAYLDYFPAYPASWYLPAPTWLGLLGIAGLVERGLGFGKSFQRVAWTFSALLLLLGTWMTFQSARTFAVQQQRVEIENRKQIGLWLKEHAEPDDTVFMECLGYIGYYSGLRTHDWPGLSSPQVVKAAKANGYDWGATLAEIKPSWVVLRPQEVVLHLGGDLSIPGCRYRLAKVFDATGRIEKLDLYGKGLLSFDSCFLVFHLEKEVAP
jgi:hypothetical protein